MHKPLSSKPSMRRAGPKFELGQVGKVGLEEPHFTESSRVPGSGVALSKCHSVLRMSFSPQDSLPLRAGVTHTHQGRDTELRDQW